MKKLFIMAAMATFLLCGATGAFAATKLRIAGNFPTDHSSSLAMELFKEKVAEYSKGDITVDTFPAMQLGGASENVDQVRSGSIFATWISIAYLSRTVPELEAVSLPFVFTSREQAFQVVDGDVGKLLDQKLADKRFTSLGYMELGFRHLTNSKRAINTIDDFKGLKIRLQPNETHLETFRAIGASPISMDIQEVYQALQQGVLDGQENPYAVSQSRNFNEIQKYLTNTGHFFDFIIIAANKRAYERFTPEQKAAIDKAMAEAIAWQRKKAADDDEICRQALIKGGMEFNAVTPELIKEMQTRTKPIIEQVSKKVGADLVNSVLRQAGM